MLSFLSALCTALLAHDAPEVRRLSGRPPMSQLPESVRSEVQAWLDAPGTSAPIHTLRHYHRTRQVLLADRLDAPPADQLELSLGAHEPPFGGSVSIARAARLADDRRLDGAPEPVLPPMRASLAGDARAVSAASPPAGAASRAGPPRSRRGPPR